MDNQGSSMPARRSRPSESGIKVRRLIDRGLAEGDEAAIGHRMISSCRLDQRRAFFTAAAQNEEISLSHQPDLPHDSASAMLCRWLAMRHIGAMVELAVKVENLVKHYSTAIAVDGISFSVGRGVTAALLGGNGAGKTTTLSILLGLLLPTAGKVQVLGEDMLRHRYLVLSRMNFSSPFVDLPHRLTVRQNLSIYARLYGLPRRRERIEALAGDLQIGEFLERPAGKLSAGQGVAAPPRRC
jgi:ABC-type glutathione transport system ATPase component